MAVLATSMLVVLFGSAGATSAPPTCKHSIDDPSTPRAGQVRAGADFQCLPMPDGASVESCVAACCVATGSRCKSFSFNQPWTLPQPYLQGCTTGRNCCCLKGSVPPLEANKWEMNITTGVVAPPPAPLCAAPGVCCSLNGKIVNEKCLCVSGWRGEDCGELDLLPVDTIDGAYQTKVNLDDCKNSKTGQGTSNPQHNVILPWSTPTGKSLTDCLRSQAVGRLPGAACRSKAPMTNTTFSRASL